MYQPVVALETATTRTMNNVSNIIHSSFSFLFVIFFFIIIFYIITPYKHLKFQIYYLIITIIINIIWPGVCAYVCVCMSIYLCIYTHVWVYTLWQPRGTASPGSGDRGKISQGSAPTRDNEPHSCSSWAGIRMAPYKKRATPAEKRGKGEEWVVAGPQHTFVKRDPNSCVCHCSEEWGIQTA